LGRADWSVESVSSLKITDVLYDTAGRDRPSVAAPQIDKEIPRLTRRGQCHAITSRDWGLPTEKALAQCAGDQSLMHALKRKCTTGIVNMAELIGADATDFGDMQKQARRDIAVENELRTRDAIQCSSKHDEQLDIVMKAIPYVEGLRNTLKRHAKLLDGRGVQRTSIGFFELIAVGTTAHDGVKAAQRAYNETRAGENAAYQQVSGRLLALQTRIEKRDSAIRIQQKQFELQITTYRDHIKKIRESAMNEQAAVVAVMEDHNATMAMCDSTRDALNVAREQYREIRWRGHNTGTIVRLHLRLCLCQNPCWSWGQSVLVPMPVSLHVPMSVLMRSCM